MKRIIYISTIAALALVFSSCATILTKKTYPLWIGDGKPENANVYADDKFVGQTPITVEIPKNIENPQTYVELRADGYENTHLNIKRKMSIGYVVADAITTAGIGLAIDYANNKIWSIKPKYILSYSMKPLVDSSKHQTPNSIANSSDSVHHGYKSLSDPNIVKYILGGFTKDKKIHLSVKNNYSELNDSAKQSIMQKIAQEFPKHDIEIYAKEQSRELWIQKDDEIYLVESWNNDSLNIRDYLPLELERNGNSKFFYYYGCNFNGSKGSHTGNLSLRVGTYLYRDWIDGSFTSNMGYNVTEGGSQFALDFGIDNRYYLNFWKRKKDAKPPKVNMAPYAGLGLSLTVSPQVYFELRFFTGFCWFVGPGSLDFGFQYGLKSSYSFNVGYTFRPAFGKTKIKKNK